MLTEFNASNTLRNANTPLPPDFRASKKDCPDQDNRLDQNIYPYSKLLGKLLWLARCTRPDLAHAVSVLGSFASNPGLKHYEALLHVLRYVRQIQTYALDI